MFKMSGDVDLILGSQGTIGWIKSMELPVLEKWRPYFVDDQLAGFTVKYDGLDFVTVKGAGHMVPQSKPKEAAYLLGKWINGEEF